MVEKKVAVLGMEKPPVRAGTPAWRNVKCHHGDHYVSSIPPCAQNKIFSYRVSLRNIPEPPEKLGVGLFIYPGLTGEIFSLPLTLTPTPSGEIPRMVLLQCRDRIFIPLALRLERHNKFWIIFLGFFPLSTLIHCFHYYFIA
jgi:hypothetical protein